MVSRRQWRVAVCSLISTLAPIMRANDRQAVSCLRASASQASFVVSAAHGVWRVSDLEEQMDENERSDHGCFQNCPANAWNAMPHHRELIRKEFLNDQRTRQKKAMILRADAGQISEPLFDHHDILQ